MTMGNWSTAWTMNQKILDDISMAATFIREMTSHAAAKQAGNHEWRGARHAAPPPAIDRQYAH